MRRSLKFQNVKR